MDGTHKGKVLWFNSVKGYGEIATNDGQRFFFKESTKTQVFTSGASVAFQQSDKFLFGKPQAQTIRILNNIVDVSLPTRKPKRDEAEA